MLEALVTLAFLGIAGLIAYVRYVNARPARPFGVNDLHETTGSLDMQITKVRSQLFIRLVQVAVHLRRAQNTLSVLGESLAERTLRLQRAVRARKNDLRKLLASSPDAIVVTNGDHRFVAANPNALQLFGVSETNIKQFTIDAFLAGGQILDFDANDLHFMK